MRRAMAVLAAGILTLLLSACGTNDIADSYATPSVTVPVQTATPTKTPTATQASGPTQTPTAKVARVLFSAVR